MRRAHLLSLLLLAGIPLPAAAQQGSGQIVSPTRVGMITYHGGTTADGYAVARVPVRYAFAICFDEVVVAYSAETDQVTVNGGYYFRGDRHAFDGDGDPPSPPTAPFVGRVYRNVTAFITRVSDQNAIRGADFGCYGQTRGVGKVVDLAGPGRTPDQLRSFLRDLRLEIDAAPRPLRNLALEGRFAAAARDSANAVRRDSLATVAREDSIARADSLARLREAGTPSTARSADSLAAAADSTLSGRDARADSAWRRAGPGRREARELTAEEQATRWTLVQAAVEAMQAADAAYRAGDKRAAARRYGAIVNGQVAGIFLPEHLALARRRHSELASDLLADDGARALASIATAEGMGGGLLYGDGYFNASWIAGATIGTARGTKLMYFDIGVGSGLVSDLMVASDTAGVEADTTDRAQFMFRLGSTLPKLRLAVGRSGWVAPHFSYTMLITDDHRLDLLTTGLAFWTPGATYFRIDAMIVSGTPALGFALGL